MSVLWTIGYEKLRPESLVAELQAAGVERVIDVRLRPQSRKPGMSKTRLGGTLAHGGIAYEHRRELGTPPELRELYRSASSEKHARAAAGFREHLEAHERAAVDALAAELVDAGAPKTALLCLEEDHEVCHRSVLAEALSERVPGLQVVHL
jgi:uncharacterized protein (DUF488 family)